MKKTALLAAILALAVTSANAADADKKVVKAAEKKVANVVTKVEAGKPEASATASHMRGADSDTSMTIVDGSTVGSSLMGSKKNF